MPLLNLQHLQHPHCQIQPELDYLQSKRKVYLLMPCRQYEPLQYQNPLLLQKYQKDWDLYAPLILRRGRFFLPRSYLQVKTLD